MWMYLFNVCILDCMYFRLYVCLYTAPCKNILIWWVHISTPHIGHETKAQLETFCFNTFFIATIGILTPHFNPLFHILGRGSNGFNFGNLFSLNRYVQRCSNVGLGVLNIIQRILYHPPLHPSDHLRPHFRND